MISKSTYPWFFFYRTARLTLMVFLPVLFILFSIARSTYQSGLIAQATNQTNEELQTLKVSLERMGIDWKEWCRGLPEFKGEGITCGPVPETTESTIFVSLNVADDIVIKKAVPLSFIRDSATDFKKALFMGIVPFAFLSYLLFVFFFYRSTRPLGLILSKVEKFKDDIPFTKSLALLYKRDEWATVEEALNKADQRLQKQIEEAQRENEKNAAILESINDDIIAIDRFESILFFNTKFKNNFMKVREGHEINKKVWHIFNDEVLAAFRSVLKTGQSKALKAKNFPESHSPDRFFELNITPLKSSNGAVTGALGVFYDVTDFKRTEQMRVDFVANVSHEIRTPLTSIKGFTQILQGQTDKVDESLRPFLDKIVTNTERMISLFNDLLSLSVIESKNHLKTEDFSLTDVVDTVEGNILASYPDKRISFHHEISLNHLRGDFRLIEQVVLNLCDNACKYAGEEVAIVISSYEKEGKAFLKIKDNGPGIAKEHLPRIFERFYRVDASRESLRGTGLGLSIVKQIISKHKGRIWAESEGPGLGTTFVIELPLK